MGWFSDVWKKVKSWFTPKQPKPPGFNIEQRGVNKVIPVIYGFVKKAKTIKVLRVTTDSSGGATNEYLHMVCIVSEGEVENLGTVYFNGISEDEIDNERYYIERFTGADDQAHCATLSNHFSKWKNTAKLSGLAYVYVRLKMNKKNTWWQGEPEITVDVAGKKVLDVRDSNVKFSMNPALCVYDYATNNRYGKGLDASKLIISDFSAAAELAKTPQGTPEAITQTSFNSANREWESIDLADTWITEWASAWLATNPGFDDPGVNGIFNTNLRMDTSQNVKENLEELLGGFRAIFTESNGQYSLKIEKDDDPVYTFDVDNLVGAIETQPGSNNERYNRVVIKYRSRLTGEEDEIFYPEDNAQYQVLLSEDNDKELDGEFTFDSIHNKAEAIQMGKVILNRSREMLGARWQGTPETMVVEVGDVVKLSSNIMGWVNKPFRVESKDIDYFTGEVSFQGVEHQPNIYPWAISDAPEDFVDTSFALPTDIAKPTGLSYSVPSNGLAQALVTWDDANNTIVSAYVLEIFNGAALIKTMETTGDKFDINFLAIGGYTLKLYAKNSLYTSEPAELSISIIDAPLTGASAFTLKATQNVDILPTKIRCNADVTWAAGAYSLEQWGGDCFVSGRLLKGQANGSEPARLMMGLSKNNGSSATFTAIDFAIYRNSNDDVHIYELSANRGLVSTATDNDVFSVHRIGSTIEYRKNGTTFYTSNVESTGNLRFDCSFVGKDSRIEDITMGAVSKGETGPRGVGAFPIPTSPAMVGGAADFVFKLNYNTSANVGEVHISGTKFQHPDGAERAFTTSWVNTSFGEGSNGQFYLMWTDEDRDTRFPSGAQWGTAQNIVPVIEQDGKWYAIDNGTLGGDAVLQEVTLQATDCFLAEITAQDTTNGLSSLFSYLSGIKGEKGDKPVAGIDYTIPEPIPGDPGERGAGRFQTSNSTGNWDNTLANTVTGGPVKDDFVIIYKANEPAIYSSRRYSGSAWVNDTPYTHGSWMIENSLDANALVAHTKMRSPKIEFVGTTHMRISAAQGFGSNNQFIEWFGPLDITNNEVNYDNLTEANAITYLKTDGSAYFGGAIISGALNTSLTTSSLSDTAEVEIGPFGSNGGNIAINCGVIMDATLAGLTTSATSAWPEPTCSIVLEEYTGTQWVTRQAGSYTGISELRQEYDGEFNKYLWTKTQSLVGSFTYTDNKQTTNARTYRVRMTARSGLQVFGVNSVSQRISINSQEN